MNSDIIAIPNIGRFPKELPLIVKTNQGDILTGKLKAAGKFLTIQQDFKVQLIKVDEIIFLSFDMPEEETNETIS